MSKTIRVALVVEGPTDTLTIEYALTSIWGKDVSFICTMIQPETSNQNLMNPPSTNYEFPGWGGVYKWCRELAQRKLSGDIFTVAELQFDMLVFQLDSDVLCCSYADYSMQQNTNAPLPLRIDSTYVQKASILPNYIKRWLYPITTRDTTVFCIPSYTLETWAYVGKHPEKKLTTPTISVEERIDLVGRIGKHKRNYQKLKDKLIENWPHVEQQCTQAKKFSDAVRAFPIHSTQ